MNNQEFLVSIKCMVYNHEPYLRQCLEGFVMQKTNFRFEAIVHDDASTDGSAAIIQEYADKYPDIIKPIYEKENQYSKRDGSLTRIINAACQGKYIAFCEGDDYWTDPYKLQKQVDFLEKNPAYALVYGKVKIYNQSHHKYERRTFGCPSNGYEDLITKGNVIPTLTAMCKSSIVKSYSDDIKGRWRMGDFPLWLYISHHSKIHFMNEYFGVYRKLLHSASSRESYTSVSRFAESGYECKLYFNNLYNSGLQAQIEESHRRRMFQYAFSYKEWDEALKWYNLGFDKNWKNKIRYFIAKHKSLHALGDYLTK